MVVCEEIPKKPRKKTVVAAAPRKVQPTVSKTKTNSGNVVKNVILINGGCCCDRGSGSVRTRNPAPTRTAPRKKPRRKARPKVSPPPETVIERVVIEPPKTRPRKKRKTYSPSPLVEYDAPRKRTSAKKRNAPKTVIVEPVVTKTKAKRKAVATAPKKRIAPKKRTVRAVAPFVEIVDYDDGYRGHILERREKTPRKAIAPPRTAKQVVEVVQVEPSSKRPHNSIGDSLWVSYNEHRERSKEKRLARRSQDVGRREEKKVVETVPTVPTYYVEESPKKLPAPEPEVLMIEPPWGFEGPREIALDNCDNYKGLRKTACKIRNRRKVSV